MTHEVALRRTLVVALWPRGCRSRIESRRKSVRQASSLASDKWQLGPSLKALAGIVCEAKLLSLLLLGILGRWPLRDLIWPGNRTASGAHFFPITVDLQLLDCHALDLERRRQSALLLSSALLFALSLRHASSPVSVPQAPSQHPCRLSLPCHRLAPAVQHEIVPFARCSSRTSRSPPATSCAYTRRSPLAQLPLMVPYNRPRSRMPDRLFAQQP